MSLHSGSGMRAQPDAGRSGLEALRAALLPLLAGRTPRLATPGPVAPPGASWPPWACSEAAEIRANTQSHGGGGRAGAAERADTGPDQRLVALVDLARAGDADAFGQLYDHYVSTIYRFLYYRLGSHALAEDLTSETFFKALRSLGSFRWQGKDFGAWLVTIARNLVADHYKSSRYRLEVTTDDFMDHDSSTGPLEDDVIAGLTNEALVETLRRLAPDQQECLVMRFLQGWSIAETARALDRSEGAIKQLQLRALRNLAKLLPDGI
jgi:RNA polymerase sigma-70 factor (ECF subfamily)